MKRVILIAILLLQTVCAADNDMDSQVTIQFEDSSSLYADLNVLNLSATLKNMFADQGENDKNLNFSDISAQGKITQQSFKLLYGLMGSIYSKKSIAEQLQLLTQQQLIDLAIAANFFDIGQLLTPIVYRLAEILIQDDNLQQFINDPGYIESLGLPDDILKLLVTEIQNIPAIQLLLASLLPNLPQKTLLQSGRVSSVVYSPDAKYLASGLLDGAIKVWDVKTGIVVHTLSGHTDSVTSVAYSPDGKYLASGLLDGLIKVWDIKAGTVVHTLSGHTDVVTSVVYSPDGKYLASSSLDWTIKVWDVKTRALVRTLIGHSNLVTSVVYSPDDKYLASSSLDGTIKIWDVKTGSLVRTLIGHAYGLKSVVYSPDGNHLASGSEDNTIKIWSVSIPGLPLELLLFILAINKGFKNNHVYSLEKIEALLDTIDKTTRIQLKKFLDPKLIRENWWRRIKEILFKSY